MLVPNSGSSLFRLYANLKIVICWMGLAMHSFFWGNIVPLPLQWIHPLKWQRSCIQTITKQYWFFKGKTRKRDYKFPTKWLQGLIPPFILLEGGYYHLPNTAFPRWSISTILERFQRGIFIHKIFLLGSRRKSRFYQNNGLYFSVFFWSF